MHIKFSILDNNKDCHLLKIDDNSEWSFSKNEEVILEVCLPGSDCPIELPYRKCSTNTLNSITLKLNCPSDCENEYLDLPDGLYKITVKDLTNDECCEIHYIRNNQLCRNLDDLIMKSDVLCSGKDDKLFKQICEIEFLIRSAQAHLRCGDTEKAMELNDRACKEAEKTC